MPAMPVSIYIYIQAFVTRGHDNEPKCIILLVLWTFKKILLAENPYIQS